MTARLGNLVGRGRSSAADETAGVESNDRCSASQLLWIAGRLFSWIRGSPCARSEMMAFGFLS